MLVTHLSRHFSALLVSQKPKQAQYEQNKWASVNLNQETSAQHHSSPSPSGSGRRLTELNRALVFKNKLHGQKAVKQNRSFKFHKLASNLTTQLPYIPHINPTKYKHLPTIYTPSHPPKATPTIAYNSHSTPKKHPDYAVHPSTPQNPHSHY